MPESRDRAVSLGRSVCAAVAGSLLLLGTSLFAQEAENAGVAQGPVAILGVELPTIDAGRVAVHESRSAAFIIGQEVVVWDLPSNRNVVRLHHPGEAPRAVAILPDGRVVAGIQPDGADLRLRFWDANAPATSAAMELADRRGGIESLIATPDGTRLLVAYEYHGIDVVDLRQMKVVRRFAGDGGIGAAAFDAASGTVALAKNGETAISLWNVATGEKTGVLPLASDDLRADALAFDAGGSALAALIYGADESLAVWDVPTKKLRYVIDPGYEPGAIAFSPRGEGFALIASDELYVQIDFRNVDDGSRVRRLQWRQPHTLTQNTISGVDAMAFSPDGRYLALSAGDVHSLWRFDDQGNFDAAPRVGNAPTPVVYPQVWTEAVRDNYVRALRFHHFCWGSLSTFYGRLGIMLADEKNDAGEPVLSWRVRMLSGYDPWKMRPAMRDDEPWDSLANTAALARARTLTGAGGDPRKTIWLKAVGPAAASPRCEKGELPSAKYIRKIAVMEVDPELAVPFPKPQEYVFDPKSPRAGLPKGGFHAMLWYGGLIYVPADVPDDVLIALFSPESQMPPEKYLERTEGTFTQFLTPRE